MYYIAMNNAGRVLTARKPTGVLYESRAGWSEELDDAKVFGSKSAATNSARKTGENNFSILRVSIKIEEE